MIGKMTIAIKSTSDFTKSFFRLHILKWNSLSPSIFYQQWIKTIIGDNFASCLCAVTMNPRARRVRFCTLRAAQLPTETRGSTAVNGAARYSSPKVKYLQPVLVTGRIPSRCYFARAALSELRARAARRRAEYTAGTNTAVHVDVACLSSPWFSEKGGLRTAHLFKKKKNVLLKGVRPVLP